LRHRPVGVRLASREIALFRTRAGAVCALEDICPHRRMRLSAGRVVDETLQCKYHGWRFDGAGLGVSPGTPRLTACAAAFDACEHHGYIWVKSKRSSPVFPTLNVAGWCWMCTAQHTAKAPLELVLDNFTEVEHTPLTHELFGFRLERMHDVSAHF